MAPGTPGRRGGAGSTRRQFLLGGAVAGVGAAGAVGLDHVLTARAGTPAAAETLAADAPADADPAGGSTGNGARTVPFHGTHQAGVATHPQAHAVFIALDLRPDVDREALARMMRILTDDAARLSRGEPALADTEPELAMTPARLTVTFGFGPALVARAQGVKPSWLHPLPAFGIDRLQPAWSDGDLLLQVAADDPLTVAHATRMLLKDSRSFATVRWTQRGFRRAHDSVPSGTTMRNLFGQVDGTVNPTVGTADFEEIVWSEQGWLAGGTAMVVRRIQMHLDRWDRLDRTGREQAIGRHLSNGAPLTSPADDPGAEFDQPDFGATDGLGFSVIPEYAHVRRARSADPAEQILRRPYSYDDPVADGDEQVSNAGLIFVAFCADVQTQFTPIQQRLDELDILNEWTTPIGSAVFAVPPGCAPGGFIGETLLA